MKYGNFCYIGIIMTQTITHPRKKVVMAVYYEQYMGYGYDLVSKPYKKWSWYWIGYVYALDVRKTVFLPEFSVN